MKRTLLVIKEALISLVEEKGFGQTSVRDLTERVEINRATFYLHSQDKYDLLNRTEDERIEAFTADNVRFYKVMLGTGGLPGLAGRMEKARSSVL